MASCSSAICGVLSINSQVQVRIRADEEIMPTLFLNIIELRLGLFMLRCICSSKGSALQCIHLYIDIIIVYSLHSCKDLKMFSTYKND